VVFVNLAPMAGLEYMAMAQEGVAEVAKALKSG
jgi:hypothetical protein